MGFQAKRRWGVDRCAPHTQWEGNRGPCHSVCGILGQAGEALPILEWVAGSPLRFSFLQPQLLLLGKEGLRVGVADLRTQHLVPRPGPVLAVLIGREWLLCDLALSVENSISWNE